VTSNQEQQQEEEEEEDSEFDMADIPLSPSPDMKHFSSSPYEPSPNSGGGEHSAVIAAKNAATALFGS